MTEHLLAPILRAIDRAGGNDYQLIVVLVPLGLGRISILQSIVEQTGFRCINVSLKLSQALLEFSRHDRADKVLKLLEDIVEQEEPLGVVLDNLEILFDPTLKLRPLEVLKECSKHRKVIAAWKGKQQHGNLLYAELNHPEYRCYSVSDIKTISVIS
jgi:hypothetical protein